MDQWLYPWNAYCVSNKPCGRLRLLREHVPKFWIPIGRWHLLFLTYLLVLVIFIFCSGNFLWSFDVRHVQWQATATGEFSTHHLNCHVQSNVINTMILVWAFYAVVRLPEKFFVLHMALNINLNFLNNAYYVTLFLGFLYMCTNLVIITVEHIHTDQFCERHFSTSAPTHLSMPQSLIRSSVS